MDTYVVDQSLSVSRWNWLNPLYAWKEIRRDIAALFRDRHIVGFLVITDMKVRYQQSFLGMIWSILNPILMLAVLVVVFSQVLQRRTVDMTFFLFSGLIPWQFFNSQVGSGGKSLIRRANLLTKIRINKLVFPVSGLLDGVINFILTTVALLILLMLVFRMPAHPQLALFPFCLVILAVFALGFSMIIMVLTVYFRDMEHIMGVVLRGWYFFTPILYPLERIKNPKMVALINLNPMTHMVNLFRCCFYAGRWPGQIEWIIPSVIAIVTMAIGYLLYKLRENELLFRL